jgi:selenide,water dikinase
MVVHGAVAVTDVTGFGVAGHLLEMLEGSELRARIARDRLKLYPGVAELARAGIRSSLLTESLSLADRIAPNGLADDLISILLDPQTSGGLLAAIPPDRAEGLVEALTAAGDEAAVIGMVEAARPGQRAGVELVEELT